MKVLVMASEVVPFAKTGGLADVAGQAAGCEVKVALPYYRMSREKGFEVEEIARLTLPLGGKLQQARLLQAEGGGGVPVYLLDAPQYYDRDQLYGYEDDAERFIFFQQAILAACKQLGWKPDVIHCNDWQTGLVPAYLKHTLASEPFFKGIGTVFTVHNLAYQGTFPPEVLELAGLPGELFTMEGLEFYGNVSFIKSGLVYADYVNTVSVGYAEEIKTPEYGEGLDGVLRARGDRVVGILNGLDYGVWNPATDEYLAANYTPDDLEGKAECKADLQRIMGLPEAPEVPVFGLVSRLSAQKGLDLLEGALPYVLERNVQFAMLGTGDPHYHEALEALARRYPDKVAVKLTFSNELAHKIYAGADLFLMPSRYEPCGLSQLISLKYGTVPVVRATGGLKDTIHEYLPRKEEGNGFVFEEYTPGAFAECIKRALLAWEAPGELWRKLQAQGMSADFSWDASAKAYLELYAKAKQAAAS